MVKNAAFIQCFKKMINPRSTRDGIVLSLATFFWIFVSWGVYCLVRDGMDAQMMRHDVMSKERHEQLWSQLVRETIEVNFLWICISILIGIFLGWCWLKYLKKRKT
jgi:Na+/H+ antiporter NhaC